MRFAFRSIFSAANFCGFAALCAAFWAGLRFFAGGANVEVFAADPALNMLTAHSILSPPFPPDGWRYPWLAYFPDFLILFFLDALPLHWRLYAFMFCLQFAAAAGWMLVVRRLRGGTLLTAAPLFLAAAQFLLLSVPAGELLVGQMLPNHHAGAWVALPYCLLGALNFHRRGGKILLAAVFAPAAASDPILLAWFAAPCVAAFFALWLAGAVHPRAAAGAALLLAAAFIGGRLAQVLLSPHDFAPFNTFAPFAYLPEHFRNLFFAARQYPLLAALWLLFCAALLALAALHLRVLFVNRGPPQGWQGWRGKKKNGKSAPPPDFPAAAFVALFLPLMMAGALGGQLLGSTRIVEGALGGGAYHIAFALRYAMPFAYLPLLFGWALLPPLAAPFVKISAAAVAPAVASKLRFLPAAALAATAALAAPGIVAVSQKSLSPLDAPYWRCVGDYAKQYGWTGGVGPMYFWNFALAHDDLPLRRMLPVERVDGAGGPAVGAAWLETANRHFFSGEFQAVVVNARGGRIFRRAPRDANDSCRAGSCGWWDDDARRITEAAALAAFGEPAKKLECEGVALWHYNPPLRFDFSSFTRYADYPRVIRGGRLL